MHRKPILGYIVVESDLTGGRPMRFVGWGMFPEPKTVKFADLRPGELFTFSSGDVHMRGPGDKYT